MRIHKYRFVKIINSDGTSEFTIQHKTIFGWKYVCSKNDMLHLSFSGNNKNIVKKNDKDSVIFWYMDWLPKKNIILQKHADVVDKHLLSE